MRESKGHNYELIPPTQGALTEHAKRDAYQAGSIWGQAVVRQPELQCPSEWGRQQMKDGQWKVFWTNIEPIAKRY